MSSYRVWWACKGQNEICWFTVLKLLPCCGDEAKKELFQGGCDSLGVCTHLRTFGTPQPTYMPDCSRPLVCDVSRTLRVKALYQYLKESYPIECAVWFGSGGRWIAVGRQGHAMAGRRGSKDPNVRFSSRLPTQFHRSEVIARLWG